MNTQAIALFPRLRLAFAALALAGLAAACSSPEVPPVDSNPSALSAEDYEASCAADGDCVTFDADLPHHFENHGKEEAVLLAIVSAGLRRS